jgi:hypothetical protein
MESLKKAIWKSIRVLYTWWFVNIPRLKNVVDDQNYIFFYDEQDNKYAIHKNKYVWYKEPRSALYSFEVKKPSRIIDSDNFKDLECVEVGVRSNFYTSYY